MESATLPRIMDHGHAPRGSHGFTLVELIVVMAILGVVATFAMPALTDFLKDMRLRSQINEVGNSFAVARSEAVRLGQSVSVCSSSNGSACRTTSATTWEDGWIVFTDSDEDGTVDSGEEVVQVHAALKGNNTLRTTVGYITYFSNGFSSNTTFRLCDDRGAGKSWAAVVSNTGRVRLTSGSSCP